MASIAPRSRELKHTGGKFICSLSHFPNFDPSTCSARKVIILSLKIRYCPSAVFNYPSVVIVKFISAYFTKPD